MWHWFINGQPIRAYRCRMLFGFDLRLIAEIAIGVAFGIFPAGFLLFVTAADAFRGHWAFA